MSKVVIKSPAEIEMMRESCRIVAEVLKIISLMIKPGVTTKELDEFAEEFIRSQKAEPAFKGYGTDKKNLFPASLCISVDDEVVHGVPSSRKLNEGEIVSVDVGVFKNKFYGDGASTYPVGKISTEKEKLMRSTEESLYKGIEKAVAGNRVHDISAAIQNHVESDGFSVVRDLVGHGVGKKLHEEPPVPNFGEKGTGIILQPGMTLAIEPMVNAGSYKVKVDSDGWTVRTVDGKPSAHFEHTILVKEHKSEILTLS
ncbi:MAG: type I methionyl aminopeptidase [Ignavibacteriales bacterium]|nr:type I methionyl aminopeptidase [Ignavibacteriales bacterium]